MPRLKRRYNRFKNKPKVPPKFDPTFEIDGGNIYATCTFLSVANLQFTESQETAWFGVVGRKLHSMYKIDADRMSIEFQPQEKRYKINFNDDAEFIMFKMTHM